MALGVAYLLGPLLLYAVLAAIRAGRQAAIGIGLWALPLLAGWAAWALALWPFTGTPRADSETVALLALWSLAILLAGAVQALRRRLGGRYALAALLLPVLALALLLPPLAL